MKLNIRRMTPADVPYAAAIERACFSDPWSEKMLMEMTHREDAVYLVAELEEERKGVSTELSQSQPEGRMKAAPEEQSQGQLGEQPNAESAAAQSVTPVALCGMGINPFEAEIYNVAVLPGFRGRGIAGRMLAELLQQGQNRGVTEFTLEVRVSNQAAIALYQRAGFVSEGMRPGYYERPKEDALIMWKR